MYWISKSNVGRHNHYSLSNSLKSNILHIQVLIITWRFVFVAEGGPAQVITDYLLTHSLLQNKHKHTYSEKQTNIRAINILYMYVCSGYNVYVRIWTLTVRTSPSPHPTCSDRTIRGISKVCVPCRFAK